MSSFSYPKSSCNVRKIREILMEWSQLYPLILNWENHTLLKNSLSKYDFKAWRWAWSVCSNSFCSSSSFQVMETMNISPVSHVSQSHSNHKYSAISFSRVFYATIGSQIALTVIRNNVYDLHWSNSHFHCWYLIYDRHWKIVVHEGRPVALSAASLRSSMLNGLLVRLK